MKTVKDVSAITGVSIRTLRYYDEIGLLKPAEFTESGYRLYDDRAIEKLQEIMFFRELEIPLADIKTIMEDPDYNKKEALLTQKALLERKRNRLNGIIELITDAAKGVNTMCFEAFNNEDVQKIIDHTLSCMSKESLAERAEEYGSIEKYREHLAAGFSNEKAAADIIKWYGGKEKAMSAVMQADGNSGALKQFQDENAKIHRQFLKAKEANDSAMAQDAVKKLAEAYKKEFCLDNARNILLDLAEEYLQNAKLAEATDGQFGEGCSAYAAHAILHYYGA